MKQRLFVLVTCISELWVRGVAVAKVFLLRIK